MKFYYIFILIVCTLVILNACTQNNFQVTNPDDVGFLIDGQDKTELKTVSRIELEKKNSTNECWVAYQGIVYDVTNFLANHPGGAQAIIRHCGTAEQFEAAFSSQHGQRQVSVLQQEGEVIGRLQ